MLSHLGPGATRRGFVTARGVTRLRTQSDSPAAERKTEIENGRDAEGRDVERERPTDSEPNDGEAACCRTDNHDDVLRQAGQAVAEVDELAR